MKRIVAMLVALMLCLSLVCMAEAGSDLEYVKGNGKLVVGITDFAPMDYKDESGEWVGFDADMAKAFAASLGVDVEFIEIDWDNKIMELDNKSIDVVWNGMTLTEDVKAAMECSNAYANNAQVVIVPAEVPLITTQCIRVPVSDGHTAAVFVNFENKPTKEQILKDWAEFRGIPQELGLPSAPKQFITYFEEDNRPQANLDRDLYGGMGVSAGRLREDSLFDWKFVGLSHNTLRGAAGGALLTAELLFRQGWLD